MALDPITTKYGPTVTDPFADMMTVIHDHFNTVSTRFSVSLVSSGGITQGFTLVHSGIVSTTQYNFRNDGTQILVGIEPSGSITDCGDSATPPTGTTSDFSGERSWEVSGGSDTFRTGCMVAITELPDWFWVCVKRADTDISHLTGVAAGYAYRPNFPDQDIPRGRDGLALLIGTPYATTGGVSGQSFFEAIGGTQSVVHIATGIWDVAYKGTVTSDPDFLDPSDVGYLSLAPVTVTTGLVASIDTYVVPFGVYKYLFSKGGSDAPFTKIEISDATEEAYIHGGSVESSGAYAMVLPWQRTVTTSLP